MDSEDEAFDEFIEIDESVRQSRTTKEQIKRIIDFAAEHDEEMYGKKSYADLWVVLSKELNKMGPPIRTSSQWKRVWSVFKYNKKKKEAQVGTEGSSSTVLDEPTYSPQPPVQPEEVADEPTYSPQPPVQPEEVAGMSVMHDHFKSEILRNFSLVLEKLDKLNLLLDEIAKKHL